jgi:hypothetical protein
LLTVVSSEFNAKPGNLFPKLHFCIPTCGEINTGHTQKNSAAYMVYSIDTAPFFCVCPVRNKF